MLAPEVLFFPLPKTTEKKAKLSSVQKCVNSDTGCYSFHPNDCHEAVASTSLKIVIPNALHPPPSLKAALTEDTQFYQATSCRLSDIIFSKEFARVFVGQGRLFLSSKINDPGRDQGIYITPAGQLCIILDQDQAQTVALDDFKVLTMESKDRKLAKLDLKKVYDPTSSLSSDKLLMRWRQSLKHVEHLFQEPIVLSWRPYDASICPSTIAKHFYDHGAHVKEIEVSLNLTRRKLSH